MSTTTVVVVVLQAVITKDWKWSNDFFDKTLRHLTISQYDLIVGLQKVQVKMNSG